MKKTHIVLLLLVAVCIGALFTTLIDASTYANLSEALANPDKEYHVVGELIRDKGIAYDPQKNASLTEFYLKDDNGVECKVILHKSKPQDIEKSEKIVLIGSAKGQDFHANDVLLKCPSKYNEGNELETADANLPNE